MSKAQSKGGSGDVPNGRATLGRQLNEVSSTTASPGRASPGKALSGISSSPPAKVRWANTLGAKRRQGSDAPATPVKKSNGNTKVWMKSVAEEDEYFEEEEEEEVREIDEIVEPEEVPRKQIQPSTLVAPNATQTLGVAKIPRQPTVDLGSKSAGAAHYDSARTPTPTKRKSSPRRAGIWKNGAVEEQLSEQQIRDKPWWRRALSPRKGEKGANARDKRTDDEDELLPWGTLDSSLTESENEPLTPTNALRKSSLRRVQHRSQCHLLLTHDRGRRELHVNDHVIARRGGEELKAIISDLSQAGEVSVVWEDGVKSNVKLKDIRDITLKVSEILAGDRVEARREDGTTCNGLVKRVELEDGIVVVDWFDGKGVDCQVASKDILRVFDIDEEDEGIEEDAATIGGDKDASRSDSNEDARSSKLGAVRRAEANRTRVSVRIAKKVSQAINVIPMNQDLTWSEFSRSCYDRFGRIHVHECHCGGNYCGVSGLCRRCGKRKGHHLPRGGTQTENICWTDDLYELVSPLLEKDVKLNHSQQQYALRAAAQRLKTPTWDWKGPSTALKSAVDAECSELVYVMLQGGVDPNEPDVRGVTPLHAASYLGRADICRLLLDGEAKVNILDRHGQSPLFFAPNTKVCRLLTEFNADLNVINDNGQTALHFVARAGLRDVLQWFTQRSSKSLSDLKDGYGVTAAQYMVLSCPQVADEALTPGSHCFSNPSMRPGPFTGHHRLPEPRWEIDRQNSDERGSSRGSSRASSRGSPPRGSKEKQKPYGKMVVEGKSP